MATMTIGSRLRQFAREAAERIGEAEQIERRIAGRPRLRARGPRQDEHGSERGKSQGPRRPTSSRPFFHLKSPMLFCVAHDHIRKPRSATIFSRLPPTRARGAGLWRAAEGCGRPFPVRPGAERPLWF